MKKVQAIIKPFRFDTVMMALRDLNLHHIFETSNEETTKGKGHPHPSLRHNEFDDFRPQRIIEVVVPDNLVERVIGVIIENARTGKLDDGKIFVTSIESGVRIINDAPLTDDDLVTLVEHEPCLA